MLVAKKEKEVFWEGDPRQKGEARTAEREGTCRGKVKQVPKGLTSRERHPLEKGGEKQISQSKKERMFFVFFLFFWFSGQGFFPGKARGRKIVKKIWMGNASKRL